MEEKNNLMKLEEILGNCEELICQLINYLKSSDNKIISEENDVFVDELVFKALEVISVVINDKKYKKDLENSQVLLNDFMNLIDKVNKNESKILLIKLLILISEKN